MKACMTCYIIMPFNCFPKVAPSFEWQHQNCNTCKANIRKEKAKRKYNALIENIGIVEFRRRRRRYKTSLHIHNGEKVCLKCLDYKCYLREFVNPNMRLMFCTECTLLEYFNYHLRSNKRIFLSKEEVRRRRLLYCKQYKLNRSIRSHKDYAVFVELDKTIKTLDKELKECEKWEER